MIISLYSMCCVQTSTRLTICLPWRLWNAISRYQQKSLLSL